MYKLLYLIKQSLKILKHNKKSFVGILLEMCIVLVLCNVVFSFLYSIDRIERDISLANANNSVTIQPFEIGWTVEQRKAELSGKVKAKIPITEDDLEKVNDLLTGHGYVYLYNDWNMGLRFKQGYYNFIIRFTNSLNINEYWCSEDLKGFLLADDYEVDPLDEKAIKKIKEDIKFDNWTKKDISEELLNKNLIIDLRVIEKNKLLLLPLRWYFQNENDIIINNHLLVLFFDGPVYGKGIAEIINLLNERHGDDFEYSVASSYRSYELRLAEIKPMTAGLSAITVGILLVILLGLSGLMVSIIQKQRKDISIRLCLGVKVKYIYIEMLILILIPCIVAGIIGTVSSHYLLARLSYVDERSFNVFTLYTPAWIKFLSLTVICFPSLVAGMLTIFNLGKIRPIKGVRLAE